MYWALRKKWLALIPLFPLLLSWVLFEPIYKSAADASTETSGIQILSYNTRSFYPGKYAEGDKGELDIFAFLKSVKADIICIQELSPLMLKGIEGYPHRYSTPPGTAHTLQAILSRYPIHHTGQVSFEGSTNNTIFADIVAGRDTLRVYNVHLESYKISSSRFVYEDYGTPFLQRMSRVALRHREQAATVKTHQRESPYPVLLCGDFNATAFSNAYHRMKRGMQDTYSEAGHGLGTTYYLKGIPYRIDYILSDPAFEVSDHRTYDVGFSDHLPLSATLRLPGD
jgi:endonuclease/exonuclease/phosphatase family metal-dependent hydrolase